MEKQTDSTSRQDFEARLSRFVFEPDNDEINQEIREFFLVLLDSDNWEKDPSTVPPVEWKGQLILTYNNLAEELWDIFWHQNTRYQGSLRAIPILSEMLPQVAPANQFFLIYYLLNIALGAVHWHLEYGFYPPRTRGAYMDEKLGIELHAAVEKHSVPRFLELTRTSKHVQLRAASLWALGWFPALAEETLPLLQQAAQDGNEKLIQDASRFAICMLEKAAHQPEDLADLEWHNNPDKKLNEDYDNLLERFSALM
jgi:hypothetical protein